jgi:non-heme chloroperoxidase
VSIEFRGHGGLRLVGDAYGDPAHRPAVLLHGGGQTRHAWGGTAAVLAEQGWYAVALDTRGHGDSDWAADGDYGVDTLVADLHCVVQALGARPAVVGASLGGITALVAEGEAPSPISRAVVLVDIAPRVDKDGVHRIISFMTGRPEGFATVEEAADAVATYNPHRPRPTTSTGLQKNLRRGADGRYRWHWDPALMSGKRSSATQDPERLETAARRLTVPTLLVRGRMSDLLSEAGARAFLDVVPHAQYADVSGAGHMVAGDRNDAFTRAVVDFLAGVP